MGKRIASYILCCFVAPVALGDLVAPFSLPVMDGLSSIASRSVTILPLTEDWAEAGIPASALEFRFDSQASHASSRGWACVLPNSMAATIPIDGPAATEAEKRLGGENIIELPPPPSGSVLTLSGLLTLGAMQLARSARNAQLASVFRVAYVPDWYHPDAVQIAHCVPFEFRFDWQRGQQAIAACIAQPIRLPWAFDPCDTDSLIRSKCQALLDHSPRSPPADL